MENTVNKEDQDLLNEFMQKYSLVEIIDGLDTLCQERASYEAEELSDTTRAKHWMWQSSLLKVFGSKLREADKNDLA